MVQSSKIYQDVSVVYSKEKKPAKKKRRLYVWLFVFFLAAFICFFVFKAGFTVSQITIDEPDDDQNIIPQKELPADDPDMMNILLLGMRGASEEGDGKLLTDAIVLLSIKKSTGQVAMLSLPRDLYLDIYCLNEKHRINFAYAQGGLQCIKDTVSWMTDQYVDQAIVSNFHAFANVIDTLGGVSVYLDSAFQERYQWAKEGWEEDEHWVIEDVDGEDSWVFKVATGTNQLDGLTTLYYVRSRFSSSDFDRMRRQQQVLLSAKKKALSLGVLTNPVKIYKLLDIAGNNIRTDMSATQIVGLIDLASDIDSSAIEKIVLDSSPQGYLFETFINDEYVLLPVNDNFDWIRQSIKDIFN